MNQYKSLINELKKILRSEGITYSAVASHLSVSEITVKRWLSQHTLSLKNLEAILTILGLEFADLVQSVNSSRALVTELTEDQEAAITSNIKLMLVINCLSNYWSVEDILNVYDIDELEGIQLLAELDRLQLIDLLPGNLVRLKFSPCLTWKGDGPIQRYYQTHTANEFFRSRFNSPSDRLLCINGNLSDKSLYEFQIQMQRLISDFSQHCASDSVLPIQQRHGATAVVAVRRFEYSAFKLLKRKRSARPFIS